MQAVQGAMQGDLFYLHIVEDLAGKAEKGDEAIEEEQNTDGDVVMGEEDGVGRDGEFNGFTEVCHNFLRTPVSIQAHIFGQTLLRAYFS